MFRYLGRPFSAALRMATMLLSLAACAPSAAPTGGEGPPEAARAVVREQLEALQRNDTPEKDAGIRTAWARAHPRNRAATGPLGRFTDMLKSPAYRDLLGHRSHRIALAGGSEVSATFVVTVYTDQGPPLAYRWTVAVIDSGKRSGEWGTTAVTPPVETGFPPV